MERGPWLAVDGLPNKCAGSLKATNENLLFKLRKREWNARFDSILASIRPWLKADRLLIASGKADRRRITHEQQKNFWTPAALFRLPPVQLEP